MTVWVWLVVGAGWVAIVGAGLCLCGAAKQGDALLERVLREESERDSAGCGRATTTGGVER